MYYFEHYLRAAGVRCLDTVRVLDGAAAPSVLSDLTEDIADVFPEADVRASGAGARDTCDLLVVPLLSPHQFPFHDVAYDELETLQAARGPAGQARFVMLYRVSWREVEVLPATALPARMRGLRLERALIRLCRRSALLRRLLASRYPS